jgi:hypothetical protein
VPIVETLQKVSIVSFLNNKLEEFQGLKPKELLLNKLRLLTKTELSFTKKEDKWALDTT